MHSKKSRWTISLRNNKKMLSIKFVYLLPSAVPSLLATNKPLSKLILSGNSLLTQHCYGFFWRWRSVSKNSAKTKTRSFILWIRDLEDFNPNYTWFKETAWPQYSSQRFKGSTTFIQSANVFLSKGAKVVAKLGDMNVSKIAKNGLLYTQTGTPYYASP